MKMKSPSAIWLVLLLCGFLTLFFNRETVAASLHDTGNEWKTKIGPFGGDRKDIVIDHHNPETVFISSSDLSGVWVSKTGGEKKSPQDFAWHRTKLQTSNTRIAGTFDDNNSFIFACKLDNADSAGLIYRLRYTQQQTDLEAIEWERITFVSPQEYKAQRVYTDPYMKERVIIAAKDVYYAARNQTIDISRLYISNAYGNSGTWQFLDFSTHPFPRNSEGNFLVKDIIYDPHNSARFFIFCGYFTDEGQGKTAVWAYHSRDGWQRITPEYNGLTYISFAVHPQQRDSYFYLFESSRQEDNNVFASGTPSGDEIEWRFSPIVSGGQTLSKPKARGLSISPHPPNYMFMGIRGTTDTASHPSSEIRGLYRSRDNGISWEKVAASDHEYMTNIKEKLYFHPTDPTIIYAGCTNFDSIRKSKSQDIGARDSWQVVTDGLDGINVFGVSPSSGRIYGVVQSSIAWKSTDGSSGWTMRQITDPDGEVTANLYGGVEVDPYNPDNILVGAGYDKPQLSHNGGIFRNTAGGYTSNPKEWDRVLYDSDEASGGVDGLANPQIMDIFFSPTQKDLVFAVASINKKTEGDRGERGIYLSEDAGQTWQWMYRDSDMYSIAQDSFAHHMYYFVGKGSSDTAAKVVAYNAQTKTLMQSPPLVINAFNQSFPTDFFYSLTIQSGIAGMVAENDALAFLGTAKGGVFFISLKNLRELFDVQSSPEDAFANFQFATDLLFPAGIDAVVAADPLRPENIYAGAKNTGMIRSSDNGRSWEVFNDGLESSSMHIYEIKFSESGKRIWAGTLGSIVYYDIEIEVPIKAPASLKISE